MCLHSTQKKAYYTKKDLVVYKIVHQRNGKYDAPYQLFTYEKNKLYRTQLSYLPGGGSFDHIATEAKDKWQYSGVDFKTIAEGFHSIYDINREIEHVNSTYNTNAFIVKAIIPKGSQYYKDNTGLIVSNQIIVTNQKVNIYDERKAKKPRK